MASIPVPKSMTDCDIDAHRLHVAREEPVIEGQRAGAMLLPASLNPYAPDEPGYGEWIRGWRSATAQTLAAKLRERARKLCDPCTCGGKGLCRDIS